MSIPSSNREIGPTGTEPGVFAPMSISCVTPAAQPISSSSQKIGTIVSTSALCTSPIEASLLQKMSPGRTPGSSSYPERIMYLIASEAVWTWTMIPRERAIESPSGV